MAVEHLLPQIVYWELSVLSGNGILTQVSGVEWGNGGNGVGLNKQPSTLQQVTSEKALLEGVV